MDNISTLQELLDVLPQCSGKEYVELVKRIQLGPEDFKGFDSWSSSKYTRNLVSRTDRYELILLCWEEGQDTPIHCHNEQECWVYAVQGEFREKRYFFNESNKNMVEASDMTLKAGRFSYMNDDMGYHSLENIAQGRTISLHLYMNPIDQCRIYDPVDKTLTWKKLYYDNTVESNK